MEANLGFSFDDTDFTDFLPEVPEEQFFSRWADFNHHDPGVTTVEALNFSYEDFMYRYNLPIQDLLQGRIKNALSSWGIMKLHPKYAVSEDDYRSVIGVYEAVYNAVAIPVLKANTKVETKKLLCLLNMNVVADSFDDVGYWEKRLLKYRAVGEYFNRQDNCETFVKQKVVAVNINAKVIYHTGKDTVKNRQKLRHALERYLLPILRGVDFRYLEKDGLGIHNLQSCFTSKPHLDSMFIRPVSLSRPSYRRYIIVAELYDVLLNLSFISSIELVEIGLVNRPYKTSVLDCGEFTFTKLNRLNVNTKEVKRGVDTKILEAIEDELSTYSRTDLSPGSFKRLGAFNSIQLSFPPNYEIGVNLANQSSTELGKTSSFRAFLYFMDQVRADTSAQMGNLSKVFTISKRACEVATRNISSSPFYQDLTFNESTVNPLLLAKDINLESEFQEERVNYLLALNGWSLVGNIVSVNTQRIDLLKIKNNFLTLVHYGFKDSMVNYGLNKIFRAVSLTLLQEKLKVVLQTDISNIRILEHCFLQPVWTGNYGLNFELTVFLFPKKKDIYEEEDFGDFEEYTKELVRAFVPSHVIPHICWIGKDRSENKYSLENLEALLVTAYPSNEVFYFDNEITDLQEEAMNTLLNDWICLD